MANFEKTNPMINKLQFDFTNFYDKAKRLSKQVGIENVTINLPFLSVTFAVNNKEKKIAQEIIIRLRDKRVLNLKECCDKCIENALKSIIEIRQFLVDKQVEINDIESPLFLLVDFTLYGIRQFLTFTEYYEPHKNRMEYFDALNVLRGHLLRSFDRINQIAGIPQEFGFRYEFNPNWDKEVYLLTKTNDKK